MNDYKAYIESFVNIEDRGIHERVQSEISNGKLWPLPLLQFNPSFIQKQSLNNLIAEGKIHTELNNVFKDYKLYKHQVEALKMGSSGKGFVVVSGTGSGKSLTYISTILDHLFKRKFESKGVTAIVVYPMNALINSQFLEFGKYAEKYKKNTNKDFPITFKKYTGQESTDDKKDTVSNPPDILLTNYVMLELLLTRNAEENLRHKIFDSLQFLVFDELHTYRGRQGSDVGLLIRKLKAQCKNEPICIGTSATMASGNTWQEQQSAIVKVANDFFAPSSPYLPEQIIGEYLEKVTLGVTSISELADTLKNGIEFSSITELIAHPISIWLEENIILEKKGDRYFRAKPRTFKEIIDNISAFSSIDTLVCEKALLDYLHNLELFNNAQASLDNKTYFPFKIHQFINQTGSVYATLESHNDREVELDAIAKTSVEKGEKPFFQIAFSRITGADLYCVLREDALNKCVPRPFNKYIEDDDIPDAGYIIIQRPDTDQLWDEQRDIENLPENWIRNDKNNIPQIKKDYKARLPEKIFIDAHGCISDRLKNDFIEAWFIPYNSNIDFTSGTVYDTRTKEGTMYSSLGVEGRSTSTNVLVFSMIRQMNGAGLDENIQKVLSFTDNRQDTALQSGHFNDFIKVGQLRSAIWRALNKNGTQDYTTILESTFEQLKINLEEYVLKPSDSGTYQHEENIKAVKGALYYKIIHDLRRGWRVILPNLEQCGLLSINYRSIEQEAEREKWTSHQITGQLSPDKIKELIFQLLDYFRKSSAVNLNALMLTEIDKNYRIFKENLKPSWLYTPNEKILYPYHVRILQTTRRRNNLYMISAGSRSAPGRFIKNFLYSEIGFKFSNAAEFEEFITWMLDELSRSGFLVRDERTTDVPLYQLNGTHILWNKGDEKSVVVDKVKNPSYLLLTPKINWYFQGFYKTDFAAGKTILAGEHSGQLKNDQRIKFEDQFRGGKLSLLCCSPTMELGIDISDLMAVHMRNVPPDPSNYAQRSGRAGRSGQAALVFTYCSASSAHDQHYFQNRIDMVAGIVQAPKLDYGNEELVRGHLYSLFLAEAGIEDLNNSLAILVDETPGPESLSLKSTVREKLSLKVEQIEKLVTIFNQTVNDFKDTEGTKDWLDENWIRKQLNDAIERFDRSLDRWRILYQNALSVIQKSSLIENDVTIPSTDEKKRNAIREKRFALKEIDLLRNVMLPNKSNNDQSEFGPYRYLAAEGFLPGFNFTRLPVRLFVPYEDGQYISRPRALAIREFGPRNSLYYMGNKFMAGRMPVNDLNAQLGRAKISLATGYILTDQNGDYDQNMDPFGVIELDGDNNRELLHNLIELSECRADEQGRITCEEEERMKEGFKIDTFFTMKRNLNSIKKLKATIADEELLEISYMPAVSLYKINRKWRTSDVQGFYMEENSGIWKKPSSLTNTVNNANPISLINVQLFTDYTADAIYIKPLKHLGLETQQDGAITLLYALKRAIENIFQVESREIGAEIMGKPEEPNIMIYEAAEGSLGILKQIIKDPTIFKKIAEEAFDICHFNKTTEEQQQFGSASYHDLLSYFNQQVHQQINRRFIKDALINLTKADYNIQTNNNFDTYEQQYEYLMNQVDPSSTTEAQLLKYLYKNKLRLPDSNQHDLRPKGCNTIPDFLYNTEVHACIFCDGIHHDREEMKKMDAQKRACVENLGYDVVVWYYKTPLEDLINQYPHIFSKVSA
jgi:superfamily II DNA/RNA helicase